MSGKISDSFLYDMLKNLSKQGDYAEIFIEKSHKQAVVFENSQLDRVENSADAGIALRVIFNGVTYFAYTCSLSEKALRDACTELKDALRQRYDKDISVTHRDNVNFYKTKINTGLDKKIRMVTDMDKAARLDKKIIQCTSMYAESIRDTRIINSDGADISQSLNYVTGFTMSVASDGKDMQTAYTPLGGAFGAEEASELDFISISEKSSRLALQNLSAGYAPSGRMTVVLGSDAGGTMVHEAVGHGLEADLACCGMSVYAGKIGEKTASDIVTVADDGTLPGKRGSFIYDDEGNKASGNVLIENGILKNYMTDRLYSMKENLPLTGNGRRQSFRHRPIVRMTNTMIMPGKTNPADIISSVSKGLYVKGMGGGQVNTVTGDFVFEVTEGYMIENGLIGSPVKNATLIGNGPKVMKDIDMVGSDLGFGIGTCGKEGQGVPVSDAQPTLRIPEITVGGQ